MRNFLKRLISFIFLLLILWLGQALVYPAIIQAISSQSWHSISGIVVENSIKSNAGKKQNQFQLNFAYSYVVYGQNYEGRSRFFSFEEPQQFWKGDLPMFVTNFPVGSSIVVYYNPYNPVESTIKKGLLFQHWILLIGNVFFFFLIIHSLLYPEKYRLKIWR